MVTASVPPALCVVCVHVHVPCKYTCLSLTRSTQSVSMHATHLHLGVAEKKKKKTKPNYSGDVNIHSSIIQAADSHKGRGRGVVNPELVSSQSQQI